MILNKLYGPDYNLLAPEELTEILKLPIEHAIGNREVVRINRILAHYDYYDGKQHKDEFGNYVSANEVERPDGMAYDPSRFTTNYFKAFIKRKARWQMGGDHGIAVQPKDQSEDAIELAKGHQDLLYELWRHNNLFSDKIRIARDRLIAGQIIAKLTFNPRTGRLHWIWHKATEVFPIYSNDGFNDLIGASIIVPKEDPEDENKTQYWVQRFRMNEEYTDCTFEEVIYDEKLNIIQTIKEETSLDIDFVPIVMFEVRDLRTKDTFNDEIEDMISLTTQLNKMMEDAQDSLKFEMFNTLVLTNVEPGTAASMQVAPGAVIEVNNQTDGKEADAKTLQNSFQWKEAFKDQYNRIKSALHELSGLPQIVPQELNFGGLNDRALQVLYQDAIQETEEHWLSWGDGFRELHEKSVRYLQARVDRNKFDYDRDLVNSIEDYSSEMNFILPLPDDRASLVELLMKETDYKFESNRGALRRLGVQDIEGKMEELTEERLENIRLFGGLDSGYERVDEDISEVVESDVDTEITDGIKT